jgi:histidine triad (HIT) family protein
LATFPHLKKSDYKMTQDCPFCRIIAGETTTPILYKDEWVTAFHDIRPLTPVHIIIVPNKHLDTLNDIQEIDEPLLGHMVRTAIQIASDNGIKESGYRLVINTGPNAGQSVFHVHLHIVGGRPMPFKM